MDSQALSHSRSQKLGEERRYMIRFPGSVNWESAIQSGGSGMVLCADRIAPCRTFHALFE